MSSFGYGLALFHDLKGTSLQTTPTLVTWTETRTFFDDVNLINANVDPNAVDSQGKSADVSFALMEALLNNTQLAKDGDQHPKYADAYVSGTQLVPVTKDSSTHFSQIITYIQPGKYSSVEYDCYQQSEARSFAEDSTRLLNPTNLTAVPYFPTNLAATNTGTSKVPYIAQIRVPSIVQSMRVTQWEALNSDNAAPASILGGARPFWNSDGIWGCKPGDLLWVGTKSSTEGTPLHRRTYTFLKNVFGWHHFYVLFRTASGVTPSDVIPINPATVSADTPSLKLINNGAAAFKMLPSKSFAEEFKKLKLPFNQGSTPSSNDPTTTTTLGDFPIMPDNIA